MVGPTQSGPHEAARGRRLLAIPLWRRTSAWADAAGAAVLLLVVAILTRPLWRIHTGVVNYVDYNLPVSVEAAVAAFRNSFSPWAGSGGLGSPNVGFLGTTEFLGLFRLVSAQFGVEVGSRLLLIILVWFDALGAYLVLRASYRIGIAGACSGALFYILNPWVYDAISQGHLYTLEVLAIAPFLILGVPRLREITTRAIVGIAVSIAIAFGSDYHLGLLILLFLGMEAIALVIRGRAARAIRLTLGVGVGLGLLSVYFFPYITSLGTIQTHNSPTSSDLAYFSNFTSWDAAFSLLRPGMNAWMEVSALGDSFRAIWFVGCVGISLVAGVIVLRGGWRWLTGSPVLPLLALASVALANGANGPTRGVAFWIYSHVPFAGIFRDPSKFLLFPLVMYVPAVGLFFAGKVPGLFRRDRASPPHHGLAAMEGTDQKGRHRGREKALLRSGWEITGPLLVVALFLPLLVPGIRTISFVPLNSDIAAQTPGARVTYLPSWQFVRYPGQSVPVNDPVQLYPRTGVAGLRPDYDIGKGNSFLRWLYTDLYFRRTDSFYDLVRLAGISDVVVREGLSAVTGNLVVQQMFAEKNLISALRTQRPTYDATRQDGNQTTRHILGASIVSSSSALLRIRGTNLGVLNDVADLTNVGEPAICFEPDCPSGNDGLTIGALNDVLPERDASNHVQIQTTDAYNRGVSSDWIDGRLAYGEGFGAITEQLFDVAVGIGRANGLLSFVGDQPKGTVQLWIQVLRGPNPIKYAVQCGETRYSVSPPLTLGGYLWIWERLGPLQVPMADSECAIGMDGRLGAVAGGTVTARSPRGGDNQDNSPKVLLSPAVAASSWRRAEASSFNYPGVTSTAAIVSDGGSLSFELPSVSSPRHVYASIVGIKGRVYVQAREVKRHPTRSVITRDQRAWIDLGELPTSQRQVELEVKGGKAAVIRVAVAAPQDMAALKAMGSSNAPIRLRGNIGLEKTGNVTVRPVTPAHRQTYLIVRLGADGLWSLDGREADGKYAGYGQLYRIGNGTSTLSSVLRARASTGAALSLFFAGGLLLVSVIPWLRRRFRRATGKHSATRR